MLVRFRVLLMYFLVGSRRAVEGDLVFGGSPDMRTWLIRMKILFSWNV